MIFNAAILAAMEAARQNNIQAQRRRQEEEEEQTRHVCPLCVEALEKMKRDNPEDTPPRK